MKLADKYEIRIVWSERDGDFVANVPELGYVSTDGPTHEKALKAARELIDIILADYEEDGQAPPEPKGFVVPDILAGRKPDMEKVAASKGKPACEIRVRIRPSRVAALKGKPAKAKGQPA